MHVCVHLLASEKRSCSLRCLDTPVSIAISTIEEVRFVWEETAVIDRRAKLGQIQGGGGGCRGPSEIRQRGGCNNCLLFTR